MRTLNSVIRNRKGAGLVEYGILTGLVAVVAIAAVANLGAEVSETFDASSTTIASHMDAALAEPTTDLALSMQLDQSVGMYTFSLDYVTPDGTDAALAMQIHFLSNNGWFLHVFYGGEQIHFAQMNFDPASGHLLEVWSPVAMGSSTRPLMVPWDDSGELQPIDLFIGTVGASDGLSQL